MFCWHKYKIVGADRLDKLTTGGFIFDYSGPGTLLLKLCEKCGKTKNETVKGSFDLGNLFEKKEEKSSPGT